MRTRGSRVSRWPHWFHDVKQRSVLRSRSALLRSGLFAFVAIAFAFASYGCGSRRGRRTPLPAPAFAPSFGNAGEREYESLILQLRYVVNAELMSCRIMPE
jgi:hypothetical protein